MASNPVLVEARRLSLLGSARAAIPLSARHQIRVEITPVCMSFCTVDNERYGNFYFEPVSSLDSAFAAFEKQASSRRLLSRGRVIIFNISSELFRTTPLDVGPNKQYKKAAELDILARRDPNQLRLDPARFCYRAYKTTDTQAHLVSLEIGVSELFDYDTRGIRVERYSLIFSAVDYLLDRHGDYFSAQTLLCVADNSRGFLFAIRRGAITGIRAVSRQAIGSAKEFRDTAQSFSFDGGPTGDGYSIMLASLTPNIDDLERAGKSMAGEIVSNVGLVGFEDMVTAVPEMQNFQGAPQYPVTLFRTGKSDLSLPFYTVREANRPAISSIQLLQIKLLRILQILLVMVAIACPVAASIYYYKSTHTPEWNVNSSDMTAKEKRVVDLRVLQAYVTRGLKISNNRLDLGHVLAAVFTDFPDDFHLERIEQTSSRTGNDVKWTITIHGLAPEDSLIPLQNFIKTVEGRMQNAFPNYKVTAQLSNTSLDPGTVGKAAGRKFLIEINLLASDTL
jgi:hypothetical protein